MTSPNPEHFNFSNLSKIIRGVNQTNLLCTFIESLFLVVYSIISLILMPQVLTVQ